jgi:hypothetical protein
VSIFVPRLSRGCPAVVVPRWLSRGSCPAAAPGPFLARTHIELAQTDTFTMRHLHFYYAKLKPPRGGGGDQYRMHVLTGAGEDSGRRKTRGVGATTRKWNRVFPFPWEPWYSASLSGMASLSVPWSNFCVIFRGIPSLPCSGVPAFSIISLPHLCFIFASSPLHLCPTSAPSLPHLCHTSAPPPPQMEKR